MNNPAILEEIAPIITQEEDTVEPVWPEGLTTYIEKAIQATLHVPEKPYVASIGDKVYYGMHESRKVIMRPAFIVYSWGDGKNPTPMVNLQVLTNNTMDFPKGHSGASGLLWATSVPYSQVPKAGCWGRWKSVPVTTIEEEEEA